jgi:hypothetical protein
MNKNAKTVAAVAGLIAPEASGLDRDFFGCNLSDSMSRKSFRM